jgi:FHA domain
MRHGDPGVLRVSIAKSGEDVSRCPEFTKAELTIGRRPTNDIILPSDGVSGVHARLLVTGRTLTLVDLGSTNGTFVAGERVVGPRPVGPHQEVLIGDFRLTFALVESGLEEAPVRARPDSRNTPRVPLAAALGWSDDPALPPPPPLLDDAPAIAPALPSLSVGDPGPSYISSGGYGGPSATMVRPPSPSSAPPRPPTPEPAIAIGVEEIFVFDPQGPEPLLEQVFTAVWSRVASDVLASVPGVDRRVSRLLEQAFTAATRLGPLPGDARARLASEMVGSAAVQALLVGDPDEVLVLGTQGVRVDRGGHISTGPSPFSCVAAVVAFGSRLCGIALTAGHPVAHRVYGEYGVQAIHGSCAGGVPTLALRRVPVRVAASLEELEAAGSVAPPHAEVLRAAVRAGLRIVLCVGPGAAARPVLGALLAAAPANELHVVVASAGADARGLRAGTVLLTRERASPHVVEAALRLRPSRLALEDLPWDDGAALDALTSSSLRVVASLRGATAAVGVQSLASMLEAQGHGLAAARAFVAASVDLLVTVAAARDGMPRIMGLAELYTHASGEVEPHVLSSFDPDRRTWSAFEASSCLDDLVHRGLLDPRVLGPRDTPEPLA